MNCKGGILIRNLKYFIAFLWERLRLILSNCRGEMHTDLFDIKDKDNVIRSTKGGRKMKSIVYFPKNKAALLELQKAVATVHAEAVVAKISSLELPRKKQNLLIDEVMNAVTPPVDSP